MICCQKWTILLFISEWLLISIDILTVSRIPYWKKVFTKSVFKYNLCRVTLMSNPKTKEWELDMVACKAA